MTSQQHATVAGIYAAFAAAPGGGSLAGVVLSPEALSAERMQSIARDFAVPTTGFVLTGAGGGELPIRFFSPRQEMDACGYATVVAATALRDAGRWHAPSTGTLVAPGGRYELTLTGNTVRLDVPVHDHRVLDHEQRNAVSALLGLAIADMPCEVITTGLRHLVVPVADDRALSAFVPGRAVAERLGTDLRVDTIALVCEQSEPGTLRLRDLCAPVGDLEEPASGTTAAAASDFIYRHRAAARLIVHQGGDMGRPSRLDTAMSPGRVVRITGTARPVLIGRLP